MSHGPKQQCMSVDAAAHGKLTGPFLEPRPRSPGTHVDGIPWCPSMKPAPSLLTSPAFFSIWAPFAFCQALAILCTDLFQGNSSLKGCSLLSSASGGQACLPTGRGFLALPALICLLQTEQVAGTWQQGEATSCKDPKAYRTSQVSLTTSAMSKKRQRTGAISWLLEVPGALQMKVAEENTVLTSSTEARGRQDKQQCLHLKGFGVRVVRVGLDGPLLPSSAGPPRSWGHLPSPPTA